MSIDRSRRYNLTENKGTENAMTIKDDYFGSSVSASGQKKACL
jgi:hypothetical protein